MFIISYLHIKNKLTEDLILLCSDSSDTQIDTRNPITIVLSFVSYYIHTYISTIIYVIFAFLVMYILYTVTVVMATVPVHNDGLKQWFFYPLGWILYGWIEYIGWFILGGKRLETDNVRGLTEIFMKSLVPNKIFQTISLNGLSDHMIPFIVGIVFCIFYSLMYLGWTWNDEKICKDKYKKVFNDRFQQGYLISFVIVVVLYVMTCIRSIVKIGKSN